MQYSQATAMNDRKGQIVFLAGAGRTGGTLIANLLSESAGLFSAGELLRIWDPVTLVDRQCGCGTRLLDCPVWSEIFHQAFGDIRKINFDRMRQQRENVGRTRSLPALLLGRQSRGTQALSGDAKEYFDVMHSLYRAISTVTKCQVIVDSSRIPSHGVLLRQFDDYKVTAIHLLRDARAVAFSFRRTESPQMPGVRLPQPPQALEKSAITWSVQNLAAEWLLWRVEGGYLRLRYEDFIARPSDTIQMIHDRFLMWPLTSKAFVNEHEVRLGPHHTISGNVNRHKTGNITLRADDEWKTKMSRASRARVMLMAWPLMLHYGYLSG